MTLWSSLICGFAPLISRVISPEVDSSPTLSCRRRDIVKSENQVSSVLFPSREIRLAHPQAWRGRAVQRLPFVHAELSLNLQNDASSKA